MRKRKGKENVGGTTDMFLLFLAVDFLIQNIDRRYQPISLRKEIEERLKKFREVIYA